MKRVRRLWHLGGETVAWATLLSDGRCFGVHDALFPIARSGRVGAPLLQQLSVVAGGLRTLQPSSLLALSEVGERIGVRLHREGGPALEGMIPVPSSARLVAAQTRDEGVAIWHALDSAYHRALVLGEEARHERFEGTLLAVGPEGEALVRTADARHLQVRAFDGEVRTTAIPKGVSNLSWSPKVLTASLGKTLFWSNEGRELRSLELSHSGQPIAVGDHVVVLGSEGRLTSVERHGGIVTAERAATGIETSRACAVDDGYVARVASFEKADALQVLDVSGEIVAQSGALPPGHWSVTQAYDAHVLVREDLHDGGVALFQLSERVAQRDRRQTELGF